MVDWQIVGRASTSGTKEVCPRLSDAGGAHGGRFRRGAQQAVGVLVATALPKAAWIAEIDLRVGADGKGLVVSHLLAAVPGQGAAQLLKQFAHRHVSITIRKK